MKLDALHQQIRDAFVVHLQLRLANASHQASDEFVELCDKCNVECCDQCAEVFCPHRDSFHGHHDGCPCCDTEDVPKGRAERVLWRIRRDKLLLKRNQNP
jgi:hypothetical protein